MVGLWNPNASNLGSASECRRPCKENVPRTHLWVCGVSYSHSNCDFAYSPDPMQKTDSEMSEEGDSCKPEQPSIPLPRNVVLRNATTTRQVQCTSHEQAAVKASEDGCLGGWIWMNMQRKARAALIASQNTSCGAAGGGFCHQWKRGIGE